MKTVKVTETTHERLTKIGDKDQSYEDIVVDLLTERRHLPKLKSVLQTASDKIEAFKKHPQYSNLGIQGANELIQVLKAFIENVEAR
jgi:predicted CopG family antitoxin